MHYLLNGTVEEVRAGRLEPAQASGAVTASVLAVLAVPPADSAAL